MPDPGHGYGTDSDCICGRNFLTVRGLREHITKARAGTTGETTMPDPATDHTLAAEPVDLDGLRARADRRKSDRDVAPDVENLIDDLLEAAATLAVAVRDAQATIHRMDAATLGALDRALGRKSDLGSVGGIEALAAERDLARAQVANVLALHAPHGRLDDLHCAQHCPGSYPCATARAAGAS